MIAIALRSRLVFGFALAIALGASLRTADWPVWRGPKGDGIATDTAVPRKWSATENVVWKVPVPGIGHSSPIVTHGRVFLTSFLSDSTDRVLLCFDRETGKLLWQKTVLTSVVEKMHKNNTPASSTPYQRRHARLGHTP